MPTPSDAIEQLTTALEGLLRAQTAVGDRLIYGDHSEPVRNTIVMSQCRVCEELDGHKAGCVVETAERVLNLMRGPKF